MSKRGRVAAGEGSRSKRRTTVRRIFVIAWSIALVVVTVTAVAAESAPPSAYVVEGAGRKPTTGLQAPGAVEAFDVRVDVAAVAANPEVLSVDLPSVGLLEAVRERFVVYQPDWKSWSGTLRYAGEEARERGFVQFGVHGDRLTALIDFDGERYLLDATPAGGQRVVRLGAERGGATSGIAASLTEDLPAPLSAPDVVAEEKRRVTAANTTECGPPYWAPGAEIDVLVVYPRAFFVQDPAIEERIKIRVRDAIDQANAIFLHGRIRALYRLVGVVPFIGQQPPLNQTLEGPRPGMKISLDWMNADPAAGYKTTPEIKTLRDAFYADVVVLYVPEDWNSGSDLGDCGVAILPVQVPCGGYYTASGSVADPGSCQDPKIWGDRAYSANRDGCGMADFTLAHEIGHNYGMRHNENLDSVQNDYHHSYPYGRGSIFSVGAATQADVMGCAHLGGPCNRVPYFSDPEADFSRDQGLQGAGVIGDSMHNARALACAKVVDYAGFRTRPNPPNQPPVPSFTISCSGMTCTFDGSGSRDYQTSIKKWSWDYGDGDPIDERGPVVSHTYTQAVERRVHLVVTDTQDQTAVLWDKVNPQVPPPQPPPPVYEGFHEVANCRSVSGWAWDKTKPNTPIDVDITHDGTFAARISANLYRSDLQGAGIGNGSHSFVYQPSWTRDGQPHAIGVRYAGTSTNLWWSPRSMTCGLSLFPTLSPTDPNLTTSGQVYTVGTQLSSSIAGYVTDLGFYRAPSEDGINTLRLYTDSGIELRSARAYCYSGGWCWAPLNPPFAISANTRYRVTVNTNYAQAKTGCGIGQGMSNQNLTAHSGYWQAGDTFPTNGSCSNFFVDVKFDM